MKRELKWLTAVAGGVVVGWLMGTYGAGQAIAIATQQRNTERDELRDLHTEQVKAVIDAGAASMAKMQAARDEAEAQAELLTPKDVQPKPTTTDRHGK